MQAICNAPIQSDVKLTDGKTLRLSVRALTILQKAEWLAAIKASARREWVKRTSELAALLPPAEKAKFLLEAARTEPDLSEEVSRMQFDVESLGVLFKLATDGKFTQAELELASAESAEEINRMLMHALELKPVEEAKEEDSPLAPSPS